MKNTLLHALSEATCLLSVSCINSMHQYALFMQVSPGSQVLLDNSERYGLYLARSLNDTSPSQLLSRKNIGIENICTLKVSETVDRQITLFFAFIAHLHLTMQ